MHKGVKAALILFAAFGGLAGALWWFIAKPNIIVGFSVGVGAVLGILFVLGEGDWRIKKRNVQQINQGDGGLVSAFFQRLIVRAPYFHRFMHPM